MEALACCCAVTYVNGSLIGDPLDVKMFESTKWILNEDSKPSKDESFSINAEKDDVAIATLYPEEVITSPLPPNF